MTTVAYPTYTNSDQLVKKFYKSTPHEDLSATILDSFRESLSTSLRPEGILYLKSNVDNEPSVAISKRLQPSNVNITIDDPQESLKSLLWCAQNLSCSAAVVCNFTPTNRIGHRINNARAAFACGLAAGFEKRLLLLGDSEYLAPVDYLIYMQHYKNSGQAIEILEKWIEPLEDTSLMPSECLWDSTPPVSLKEIPWGRKHAGTPPEIAPRSERGCGCPQFFPDACEAISLNGLFNFDQFSESRSFILLYHSARFLCPGKSPQL
jgi:hypothetical protein